ncbi:hypothetical protein BGX38DRAFT_1151774, partial [Terfezia claveryi]
MELIGIIIWALDGRGRYQEHWKCHGNEVDHELCPGYFCFPGACKFMVFFLFSLFLILYHTPKVLQYIQHPVIFV